MGRPRSYERVLGPYKSFGGRYRVIEIDAAGRRESSYFDRERNAQKYAERIRSRIEEAEKDRTLTVAIAVDRYRQYLAGKGNRESSITTTMHRLRSFFGTGLVPLRSVSPRWCKDRYREVAAETKVDTHRNTVAEARTFTRWCAKQGWLSGDPLAGIELLGRRRKGKAQLRIDEARRWEAKALELAEEGEAGAVAALMAYWMGMRAGEIVGRTVRDLDDQGRVLWIGEAKTQAGVRRVRVPVDLQPHLLRLVHGRRSDDPLLGEHLRDWVLRWVRRICREAKVPIVTAHGMRGLFATVALEEGISLERASRSIGHANTEVTRQHYAEPGAVAASGQRAALRVLRGGKGAA